MRYKLIAIFSFIVCTHSAQIKWNSRYQDYINTYKDLAIEEMLKYRIPASITLAQGLLESGAGSSELVRKGNNHFGIKCHDWTGARTYKNDDERNECFRVYLSAKDSYEDHSKFLQKSRYQSLYTLNIRDYKGWAHGLKAAGYATNPRYAYQLISLIETYNLHEYDKAKHYNKFIASHSGNYSFSNTLSGLHAIKMYNDNYYLIARKGDTFKSIAREVELKARHIARVNERNVKDVLVEGDIIYLKKKKKRAERVYKNMPHVVTSGESLYSISQKYGIQLKSLYKMNNLDKDASIFVGQRLRIY